jgi:flagellar hook-length control protein FliK
VAALGLILCAQNVPERDAPPPAVTTCVLPAPGAEAPATNQPEEQVEVVPSLETAFPPQPLSEGVEQPPPAVRTPETSRDHESSRSFDLPPQGVSRFGGRTLLTASQATVGVPTEDDAATETTAGVAAPVVQDEPLPIEITPRDVDSQAFEAGRTTGRAPSLATRPKGEVPTASAPETMTAPPVKRAPAEAASGPAPGASAAPSTVDGSTPAPDAALSTPGSAEARRADVPSRLAANRLSSFNEARPRARAVLGAEQVWNAWQTESINSSTIARAVTAAAAAIRLEADVFPTKAAAVAQPMGPAAGVPFTSIVPAELKPVESAAQTAATNVATRAAEPIDVPSQIVRSAQLQWRDGVGEAKLKLTPENLGEVTISLRVEQGSVFATVRAESAAAMQAIQARQQELQSALEAQGLHLDHLILSTDPDRQRDQQQPQHRAPKRAHLKPQANESGETPRFEILA